MPRIRNPPGKSRLEEKVAADLQLFGLMDACERQHRFHPSRKWLIDFAWPGRRVALEVNGGTYLQGKFRGAHSRGDRQRKDFEKWSTLSLMGWTVLLVDSVDVKQGVHIERVLRALRKS